MVDKTNKKQIQEFVSDDLQSTIPDPVAEPSNARPADAPNASEPQQAYNTQAAFMAGILQMVRALTPDQLSAVFSGMQSYMPGGGGDNAVSHGRPAATQNQATLNPGGGVVPQMPMPSLTHEALDKMFADSGLSEDFKETATTVFEAAVTERLIMLEAELTDKVEKQLTEEKEKLAEEQKTAIAGLREGLDNYLGMAIGKWMKDNQIAIDSSLKAQMGESILAGLKALAEDHNIVIDEVTESAVEELKAKVEGADAKYNELAESLVAANKRIESFLRKEIVESVCAGMTATQISKLQALTETAEFITEESFRKKVAVIKEQFVAEGEKPTKAKHELPVVDENTDVKTTKTADPIMERYIAAARNSAKYK